MVNIYGSSCFHFTLVSESRFLDPGHNHYCRLIFIMLFLAPSPVPDFLFWPIFPYRIPIFFFSSTTVFPLNLLQKLRKQFQSMTPCELGVHVLFACLNPSLDIPFLGAFLEQRCLYQHSEAHL